MKNIFICFALFWGCKAAKQVDTSNDPCQKYLNALKVSCRRDSIGLFKFTAQGLDRSKENCLVGLGRNQAKNIFGEPNYENAYSLVYYLSSECLNNKPDIEKIGCLKFQLIFDIETDTLKKIPAILREGGRKY
jgi:hypothetical protein